MGKAYKITDENEAPLEFDNAVGALNFLGKRGWELVSVYERDMKGAGRRTFYLLRLDTSRSPGDDIAKAIDEAKASRER